MLARAFLLLINRASVPGGVFSRSGLFHPDLEDAAFRGFLNFENVAVERDRVADIKDLAGFGHQETRDRRVAFGYRQVHRQATVKVTDGKPALKDKTAVRLCVYLLVDLFVVLV